MKGPQTLPQELRKRAERFFGVSFSDLEISADERVAELGARAFAYGRHVYVSPRYTDFEQPENLFLLGHELAHVVQQMEGRAPAGARIAGLPLNDDPRLEAEADELGRRFATGGPALERRSSNLSAPSEPVVQRTVITGGLLLQPPEPPHPLGRKVRQVLSLVDGGQEWLDWAVVEPGETFRFPDNAALVEGIQTGLHGSPLMLLSRLGLLISPKKLLALPEDVLAAIQAWEEQGGSASEKNALCNTLRAYEIFTQDDLEPVSQFLEDAGVADAPVFQVLSLMDQILLLHFVHGELGLQNALLTEAAKFGVEHADNPAEFIDYAELFLAVAAQQPSSGAKAPTKAGKAKIWRRAEGVLADLRPYMPGFLRGLSFGEVPSPGELEASLVQWIGSGQILGFQRFSTAAVQIYRQSGLEHESGTSMGTVIDAYMDQVSRFLTSQRPDPVVMMQNGATCFYRMEGEDGKGVLWLSPDLCLTLRSFEPAPNTSATPEAQRREPAKSRKPAKSRGTAKKGTEDET